jgi:predicted flap endonuclease-1-like 5' DNA nuclease
MANRAMDTRADDMSRSQTRSGVVAVERKASPVTAAMQPVNHRDLNIEVDTEQAGVAPRGALRSSLSASEGSASERGASGRADDPQATTGIIVKASAAAKEAGAKEAAAKEAAAKQAGPSGVTLQPSSSAASDASQIITKDGSLDDEAIQVLDEEIESALPSLSVSGFLERSTRSRTPPPLRPRAASSSPPRQSWAPGSSLPPPSSPDPWLAANRRLELGRAHARILDLEEQIAFRDVRIQALEERVAALQQRLESAESKAAEAPPAMAFRVPLPRERVSLDELPLDVEVTPEPTGVRAASGALKRTREKLSESAPPTEHAVLAGPAEKLSAPAAPDVGAPGGAEPSGGELQRIGDIGARFEAALRKQGITQLRQIAEWSEADVRQVAKALKIPKSRILKGRWIEVAREMIGSRRSSE